MVTISEIAKNLNISKATVSKALNGASDINAATRKRVIGEATRLGYTKTFRKKKNFTSTVGIICPEITSYYYARLVTVLTNNLKEKGFDVLLTLSNYRVEAESELLSQLTQANVCGILLITESSKPHRQDAFLLVPTVVIGLNFDTPLCDVVSINEKRGIEAIAQHLVSQGHRKIGFIGESLVTDRLDYLKEALLPYGIGVPNEFTVLSDERQGNCGYINTVKLLSSGNRPTAIVAGYDAIALGVYRALSEHGIRVPEDIAIVSFDDSDSCGFLPVSLSSVNYDIPTECRVAIAILLGRIGNRNQPAVQTTAITPRLIVRESSLHRVSD